MKKQINKLQISNPPKPSLEKGGSRLLFEKVNKPAFFEKNFSLFTSHFSLKRRAFTLAEVLITLGIIGVVAALTMPILISHYKKQVVEVRLQRAYTTLAQAIKLATVDYGEPSGWDFTSSEVAAKKYLMPYMPGAKFIREADMIYKFKFQNEDTLYPFNGGNASGIMLKTGEIIRIYQPQGNSLQAQQLNVTLKRNKDNIYIIGKDYFPFYLFIDKNILSFYPAQSYANIPEDTLVSYCQIYGREWACGALIAKNSWKIPNNYPVKF